MINDNSKPLIFIGANSALFILTDLCEQHGIRVAGIIDKDYYGNTDDINGVPVIDTEESFFDAARLAEYKRNYNFFLATNWTGNLDDVQTRNRAKRQYLIDVIEQNELPCISLVDTAARVHKSNKIGKCVVIDAFVYITANNIIGDYTCFYASSMLGYHNVVGRNCMFQRHAGLTHYNQIGDNVYVSFYAGESRGNLTIASGTVLHPCIMLRRSTRENEVISLAGKNLHQVYSTFSEEN
jgi:hypothetical protein